VAREALRRGLALLEEGDGLVAIEGGRPRGQCMVAARGKAVALAVDFLAVADRHYFYPAATIVDLVDNPPITHADAIALQMMWLELSATGRSRVEL
jgi:hypothetical protein